MAARTTKRDAHAKYSSLTALLQIHTDACSDEHDHRDPELDRGCVTWMRDESVRADHDTSRDYNERRYPTPSGRPGTGWIGHESLLS